MRRHRKLQRTPRELTYALVNDRDIVSLYVNNSGIKDDVQLTGKYVFINLGIENEDPYDLPRPGRVQHCGARAPALSSFYLFQQEPIETLSGNIIPPSGRIEISEELRIGVDGFETFTYTNEENGTWLNYHLYIPEGYDTKGDAWPTCRWWCTIPLATTAT